jgi:hypothetical protein
MGLKVIVDWSGQFVSQIELLDSDLEALNEAGISWEDGAGIEKWLRKQEWLKEELRDTIFESYTPSVGDVEVQDDDGTVVI